jgi:hypothetical protein
MKFIISFIIYVLYIFIFWVKYYLATISISVISYTFLWKMSHYSRRTINRLIRIVIFIYRPYNAIWRKLPSGYGVGTCV